MTRGRTAAAGTLPLLLCYSSRSLLIEGGSSLSFYSTNVIFPSIRQSRPVRQSQSRLFSLLIRGDPPTSGRRASSPFTTNTAIAAAPAASSFTMASFSEDDIRKLKQQMRKSIRTQMREMSQEQIETQSRQVWNKLFQLPEYKNSKAISAFLSMPSGEICTEAVIENALSSGKSIYVPQVGKNFEQAEMELLKAPTATTATEQNNGDGPQLFYHGWPRNKWGIPEPPLDLRDKLPQANPGDIDLFIVPGLGFDANGDRLGQGKGYYDRFIARMMEVDESKQQKPPLLVAVGLSCQLVDGTIPVHIHDCRMDIVLLPDKTIIVNKEI